MKKLLRNHTFQDGLVVTMLALAFLIHAIVQFLHMSARVAWIMSPYLFPMILGAMGLLLGLVILYGGIREVRGNTDTGAEKACPDRLGFLRVLVVIALTIAYDALLPRLGFIPATMLFLAVMVCFLGERRWYRILLIAVITPLVLYAIFKLGLNVRLP